MKIGACADRPEILSIDNDEYSVYDEKSSENVGVCAQR
jgi:hypothetical protein